MSHVGWYFAAEILRNAPFFLTWVIVMSQRWAAVSIAVSSEGSVCCGTCSHSTSWHCLKSSKAVCLLNLLHWRTILQSGKCQKHKASRNYKLSVLTYRRSLSLSANRGHWVCQEEGEEEQEEGQGERLQWWRSRKPQWHRRPRCCGEYKHFISQCQPDLGQIRCCKLQVCSI